MAISIRDIVLAARDKLVNVEDTLCLDRAMLVTEAWQRYAHLAMPLRRAQVLAHVLDHMVLDLPANPIFAGNTSSQSRGWMLLPEYGLMADRQGIIEHPKLDGLMEGVPQTLHTFWQEENTGCPSGVGHLAVDMQVVVHTGLHGILQQVFTAGITEDGAGQYRQAMAIALEAVMRWAQRYAEAAQLQAVHEPDPRLRMLYLRVAGACRHVPALPARNLFEALQAVVLVHLATSIEGHGYSISIGLLDRILAPFANEMPDDHGLTDLLAAFLLKISANAFMGRVSKTQAITIGGQYADGTDAANRITLAVLRAADLVRVGDPHVFLRWHDRLADTVKVQAVHMLAHGVSMPLLVHDAPTMAGLQRLGISADDASEYCVIGCNELGIPGRCMSIATSRHGFIQYGQVLRDVVLEVSPTELATVEMTTVLKALEERLFLQLDAARVQGTMKVDEEASQRPTPFTSSLMKNCITAGADLLVAMPYDFPSIYELGLVNAVNALAIMDELVFTTGKLRWEELQGALCDNFADESVALMVGQAAKWGNDNPTVDGWMHELLALRERVLARVDECHGHKVHSVCHVVRSLHHLFGSNLPATPDGRRAGLPLADSIGAVAGTAGNGPTATLASVASIEAPRYFTGGYNVNLTLPGSGATPEIVRGIVEGFFAVGGQELQVNVLDPDELRDAQQHPERYTHLLVRVAGLSARFIDLGPTEQDELIYRGEQAR